MSSPAEIENLLDVPARFEAVLPGPLLSVGELLKLTEGSLINTGRPAGETIDIFAAGALIGVAELSDVKGHRAVRMVRFQGGGR